jgi:4'-phosphopantetheinyl transferase EntD
MTLLDGLLAPGIVTAMGDPRADWPGPLPGEEEALARASAMRRREFLSGRALARRAMQDLGRPPSPIPAASDRTPVWPPGLTGSISHCADLCAAAMARTADGFLSIGIDIETAEPLERSLWPEICTPAERERLARQPGDEAGALAKLMFSAKEAAYKCQYPLSRQLFDFQVFEIELDLAAGTFGARFAIDVAPFRRGDALQGRFRTTAGHVATATSLRRLPGDDRDGRTHHG